MMKLDIQLSRFLSSIEGTALFLLIAYRKMLDERWIEDGIVKQKEPEFKYMEKFQPVHIVENEKARSAENAYSVGTNYLTRRLQWV